MLTRPTCIYQPRLIWNGDSFKSLKDLAWVITVAARSDSWHCRINILHWWSLFRLQDPATACGVRKDSKVNEALLIFQTSPTNYSRSFSVLGFSQTRQIERDNVTRPLLIVWLLWALVSVIEKRTISFSVGLVAQWAPESWVTVSSLPPLFLLPLPSGSLAWSFLRQSFTLLKCTVPLCKFSTLLSVWGFPSTLSVTTGSKFWVL